jgi:hypothetical protein
MKKMNWGHRLLIVILLFVGSMTGMVFYAARQDNEMIDDHYYQKEIAYQQVIDAQHNLNAIATEQMVSMDSNDIVIRFPADTYEQMKEGWIELLHHAMSSGDHRMAIAPDLSGHFRIPRSALVSGSYKLRIRWINAGVPYYLEQQIHIRA